MTTRPRGSETGSGACSMATKRTKRLPPHTGKRTTSKGLPDEMAALMLARAAVKTDAVAAKEFGVSTKTVQRYRARSREVQALAEMVQVETRKLRDGLGTKIADALYATADRIIELAAAEKNIRDVAGAFKLLSDQVTVAKVLGVSHERPAPAGADPGAAAAPAGANGADGAAHHPAAIN